MQTEVVAASRDAQKPKRPTKKRPIKKRAKRVNPRLEADVRIEACNSPFFTVPQFPKRHPAFTEDSLRWQIFNEHKNGLAESGAIIRVGQTIYLDEVKYLAWFRSQGRKA